MHGKYVAPSIHRRCLQDWMGVFRDRSIDLVSQHSYLEHFAKIGRLNFIVIIPLGTAVYLIAKHLKYYMLQFDPNRICFILGTISIVLRSLGIVQLLPSHKDNH